MHLTRAEPPRGIRRRKSFAIAAGFYLLFVVYGSLVPLDFRPYPLDAAWRDFLGTGYLVLGVASRADWVANILLYIPLAYLLSAAFAAGAKSAGGRALRVALVFAVCAAVAVGVEFIQLFFPPRTVSINDIVAELIGTGLGVGMWLIWGDALDRLWTEMERGGLPAIRAAVVGYVLAYLAFSLFPYDFLVSAQEYSEKFAGGGYGLMVASETCERMSSCAGKLIAEIIAVVPLGLLLGIAIGRSARRVYLTAALCGLALGLTIEVTQLFLASGVSEGMSLLTRAAGVCLGVALHRHVRLQRLMDLQPYLVGALFVASPIYLAALMWANAWFGARWVGMEQARAVLDGVRWLPFYYHYFTTETHALRSLLAEVAMYLPVGIAYWIWTLRRARAHVAGSVLIPALVAALLALVMEMGKLFLPGKHPDPTDVPIAMFAAAAAYRLARQFYQWALQEEPAPPASSPVREESPGGGTRPAASSVAARALPLFLLLGGTGMALLNYPLGGVWLTLALCLYGAVLWRFPGVCLPAVIALLPWLNFSMFSGWILLNEFDLLIAVTLIVRLLQTHPDHADATLSRGAKWIVMLLAASFFVSAVVGLLPLSSLDQNALASYYSNFNSLRQLKGFAWALALLPMLIEEARNPLRMEQRWVAGMLVGLCGVLGVILWERAVFAGLADFSAEYRAEGPFPELHTGGGDIHAYLVTAIPFVFLWIALRPTLARVASGMLLFMLASYALGVTFARGGYVGYAGVMGVLGFAAVVYWLRQGVGKARHIAIAAVPAVAGLAVMIPILLGSFMEARLAGSHTEAATRTRHWVHAIDMMDGGVATALFGMGLGSFPKTFLFLDRENASATFSYEREGANGFVRLGSGRPLFLGQRVSTVAGRSYQLSLDIRSASPKAKIDLSLCERSVQQSFRCKWQSFTVKIAGKGWEHNEVTLNSDEVGSGIWPMRRPVVLSVSNAQPGSLVDVDNVRLTDESGNDLLANGDFSRGGARWFFSADDHLPWHIFNLWVQILFEQGWIGVLSFVAVVMMVLTRLVLGTWKGDRYSAALLAALFGFLLIGFTESLFDSPRITTLFYLLLFAGLLHPNGQGFGSSRRPAHAGNGPGTVPHAEHGTFSARRGNDA